MDLLKAMHTFRTVVEQRSFSGAARELNVVVSAVSRQVSDLEQRLGCKLLQRSTRSMTLTEEGREYLANIDDILERVDRLEQDVSERQQTIAGQLRITSSLHSRAMGLQPLISQFLQTYPDVRLSWLILNRYVNLVEEGIDLAIRVGELPDSGMIAREIGQIEIYFVASPDYLAHRGEPQTPKQLTAHRCILDGSNQQPGRWRYQSETGIKHVSVTDTIEVTNGELVADFAADDLGIACLPDFLVAQHLASGKLIRILQDYQVAAVPISLVYPANRIMKQAQRALIDFLVEHRLDSSVDESNTRANQGF